MQYAADMFGYLGIASTLLITLQKERRNLLLWKFICDIFWLTHFILIGASSAVAIVLAALLRTWVFMNSGHAWARGKRWLYIFLAVSVVFSAIGWEGPISLFTLVASMASVVAFWCDTPKMTRMITIPTCFLYLTYYFYIGSLQPIICEVFSLVSSVIGFVRYDRKTGAASRDAKV